MIPAVLRVGVAGCFIGHGAFGIMTRAAWVPYFGVVGIRPPWAWKLMPWVGVTDVVVAILALSWPCRAVFAWATSWAVWTALLRPLSGEPLWEALERAGNYGVPLALLMVIGLRGPWFARLPGRWPELTEIVRTRLAWTLRLTTFTLLAGHAGLGLFTHKAGLAEHYAALGITNSAAVTIRVGAFEFILAALALVFPGPALLVGVCAWKVATESLFLLSGAPIWEFIERAGSYTAPMALACLLLAKRRIPSDCNTAAADLASV